MNLFIKVIVTILFLVIASYHLFFFISPSVTIKNKSDNVITKVVVRLPDSRLNFGFIDHNQESTIYYTLSQNDGRYDYSLNIDGKTITGNCGYLTNNEFNKRFVITVTKSHHVYCSQ